MDDTNSYYFEKSTIVTGASEGIGRAFCLEIARHKPRLTIAARNQQRLDELKTELERLGAEVLAVKTDVGNATDCKALIAAASERFGSIDILVNNAGITMWSLFEDLQDLKAFENIFRVNVMGAIYCTHAALPALKKSGGTIVAVTSLAGLTGVPSRSIYSMSKHAMVGFFDSLRIELSESGVNVVNVAPDFVLSEIHKRALDGKGTALGHSPMNTDKIMTAEKFAVFMASSIARGTRLAIPSLRGRLGRWVKLIAPEFIDKLAKRAIASGH